MSFPSLTDIRSRVWTLMNESSSSTFLPSTVLNRFINEAERQIATKTGCLESIDSTSTIASTRTVQFSGHKIKDIEYIPGSGNRIGLQQLTLKHLGSAQADSTTPQYFCQWGNKALIEPMPGTTTYSLYLYLSDYPQVEMSEDTDTPSIPASFYEDIVQYAFFLSLVRDRKFQQASFIYNRYIESIQAKKQLIVAQKPDSPMAKKIPTVVVVPQQQGNQSNQGGQQ